MYVDYKVTVWKRVHFNVNTDPKKVIQVLEEEGIEGVFDEELGFVEQELLYDPEENESCSTIEVYENNNPGNDLIWSNGKD